MAVFRVEKNQGYTVMSNCHLRDRNLSLRAKGLLSHILSLPEDWDYTIAGLAAINKEGKDAVRAAVHELEEAGYIVRRQKVDAGGKFSSNEYVVYESPHSASPLSGFPTTVLPTTEKPSTEKPLSENPTEINKDINKKKNKKEKGKALTDEQLHELFMAWIMGVATYEWTRDIKNTLYLALDGFYAPRAIKKQEPARTKAAFTALSNRLVRFSAGNPSVMIDMLERATTAGWKSVYAPNGGNGSQANPPDEGRSEEWL